MIRFLQKICMLYLMSSVLVCALPRCGYIIETLASLHVSTVGASCHESHGGDSEADLDSFGSFISNDRFCQCELMSFVVTPPLEPIRTVERVEEELFTDQAIHKSFYLSKISLALITPPPKSIS